MKLLTTTAAIKRELSRLLRECSACRIAVAWASVGFDAFELLKKHSKKIERMVVGTHFYQTHPSFIEAFVAHPNVRIVMNTEELFHPKVYFFEKIPGAWECIVGSPNFTQGGFGTNDEMAVLVTSEDQVAADALDRINDSLHGYWRKSSSLSKLDYKVYEEAWKKKWPILRNLCGKFGNPKDADSDDKGNPPLDVPILRMTWADYFGKVKSEKATSDGPSMTERIKVIKAAQRLFSEYSNFNKIGPDGRRQLAGLHGVVNGVNHAFFGSMKGAGKFWKAVKDNDENLSLALDLIPHSGNITREIYLQYIGRYKQAFPDSRAGVATATRLLAMKRPDTFVCLDDENKRLLCSAAILESVPLLVMRSIGIPSSPVSWNRPGGIRHRQVLSPSTRYGEPERHFSIRFIMKETRKWQTVIPKNRAGYCYSS